MLKDLACILSIRPTWQSVLAVILCLVSFENSLATPKDQVREYQVKAVYLYNFTHFIHWPTQIKNPFHICVLGESPFNDALFYAIKQEKINEQPIEAQYISHVRDTSPCQILFISQSEQGQLAFILDYLKNRPILTVSDIPEFIEQGGMIKFYLNRKSQVRLAINLNSLQEANLKADANLLRISQVSRK